MKTIKNAFLYSTCSDSYSQLRQILSIKAKNILTFRPFRLQKDQILQFP